MLTWECKRGCLPASLSLSFCLSLPVCLSGVNALLAVALDGVRDSSQIQMVEFGRGFGYKVPLSVGMQSVGSTLLKQIVSPP